MMKRWAGNRPPWWRVGLYYLLLYAGLMVSFFLIAFSTAFCVQASFGLSPWDVFHWGLTAHLPLTLGQATVLTGALVMVISFFLGVKPYSATFLNMLLIGSFYDLIVLWQWVPPVTTLGLRIVYFLLGLITMGIGSAGYFKAGLGFGPRDGLMMGISYKSGKRIGLIRTIMEVAAVLIGWLLGGIFGVGTVIYSLSVGWVIEVAIKAVDWLLALRPIRFFLAQIRPPWRLAAEEAGEEPLPNHSTGGD